LLGAVPQIDRLRDVAENFDAIDDVGMAERSTGRRHGRRIDGFEVVERKHTANRFAHPSVVVHDLGCAKGQIRAGSVRSACSDPGAMRTAAVSGTRRNDIEQCLAGYRLNQRM
jgi:hypothetical protein